MTATPLSRSRVPRWWTEAPRSSRWLPRSPPSVPRSWSPDTLWCSAIRRGSPSVLPEGHVRQKRRRPRPRAAPGWGSGCGCGGREAHQEEAADIAALSDTVARLASEGADSARSQFRDSAGRAVRGANAAGEQLYQDAAALGRDAAKTAHIATAEIESQIARNPIATVLIALGIGFAVGVLSRR
jgi:ElaB/YqjD/DUF883 family membrane-anchored ribosome-binding protein